MVLVPALENAIASEQGAVGGVITGDGRRVRLGRPHAGLGPADLGDNQGFARAQCLADPVEDCEDGCAFAFCIINL